MRDGVETNREDDEERSGEKVCNTCMKRNIPKILYCGHVIWICQKCLSEANSDQICCPKCQGPLVDPLLAGNGGGNILQENLFTDLFQDEKYDKHIVFHERSRWCSLPHKWNIPSVYFCRLCTQMLCQDCSDRHPPYHFLQNLERIQNYHVKRKSPPCLIHSTDSTHFCSTHNVPICRNCNSYHTDCSVKNISEELKDRTQMLSSKYAELGERESFFRKEQQNAEKRHQEYKKLINDEFEQLVKEELEMRLGKKYKEVREVLDRKLRRVIEHKSLVKCAQSSPPTHAFFDMTPTLQVLCDNVVSDTSVPDDMTLEMHKDDISTVRAAIERLGELIDPQQNDVLYFDNLHGKNIILLENNKVAQRFQGSENGIVLSSQPMECDKLYQVEVLGFEARRKGTMQIGVCWNDAKKAALALPQTRSSMLISSAIIGAYWIWKDGKKVEKSGAYGKKLKDIKNGSRVGILIRSTDSRLHLFIDGVDCGPSSKIDPKELNNPYFAVFDVRSKVKKIQALPLKKVSTFSPTMFSPILSCGISSCKTCKQLNSACSISGPRGDLNLTSTGFRCDSTHVVYVVKCNKCNMLYIGETRGRIRDRCTDHRNDDPSSVHKHKSECKSGFSIGGVYKDLQNDYQRKVMETILMLKLGTLHPSGINKKLSVEMR